MNEIGELAFKVADSNPDAMDILFKIDHEVNNLLDTFIDQEQGSLYDKNGNRLQAYRSKHFSRKMTMDILKYLDENNILGFRLIQLYRDEFFEKASLMTNHIKDKVCAGKPYNLYENLDQTYRGGELRKVLDREKELG